MLHASAPIATSLPSQGWRKTPAPAWVLWLLLASTVLCFAGALQGPAVYDDRLIIERNPALADFSKLPDFFTHALWDFAPEAAAGSIGFWRPFTLALLALGQRLGDGQPWAFHLLALLAHLAAVTAAWLLLRRLLPTVWLAAGATALFALHPVQVESLAWMSAINDPVAGALLLWAVERWLAWRARGSHGLPWSSALCLAAALLTKESALALVPLLLLVECTRDRTLPRAPWRGWLCISAVLLLFWLARCWVFGDALAGFDRRSGNFNFDLERLVQLRLELFGGALRLMLWPADLALFRMLRPHLPWFDRDLLLAVGASLGWLGLVVWGLRRARALGWLWILACLLPLLVSPESSGRFPLSDRYLYPALLGFALALAHLGAAWPRASGLLLLALALACGWSSQAQLEVWRSETSLYSAQVEREPENPYAWWGLGRVRYESYQASGDTRQLGAAQEAFVRAQDLVDASRQPDTQIFATPEDFLQANLGVGFCLLQEAGVDGYRDYESAQRVFELILEARPTSPEARQGLGQALLAQGRLDEAERAFLDALSIEPRRPEVHQNLGLLAMRRHDYERARRHFEDALALRPRDIDDLLNLARALLELGWNERARAQAERARELGPQRAEPLVVLATIAARERDPEGALALLDRALQLDPESSGAHYLRGQLLVATGDTSAAILAFRRACELAPADPDAHYNLGALLLASGAKEAARPYLVRAYEQADSPRVLTELRALFAGDAQADAALYWQLARADQARAANEQALSWLEEGERRDPQHAPTQYLLGILCEAAGREAEALAHLERAVLLQPNSFEAHHSLARQLERAGQLERAAEELAAALRLAPSAGADPEFERGVRASLQSDLDRLRQR